MMMQDNAIRCRERSYMNKQQKESQLYEMLLTEAAETGSAVEEIAEFCFRKFIERDRDNVN